MRKSASLLMMLMLFSALAFAQTRTVTGQVTDEKGTPVSFASVVEDGTSNGTKADPDGRFRRHERVHQALRGDGCGRP